mmetsp:Transcript_8726/g.18298  ORF Transcript_8726/g.18298 Transcript_8726/m.18298 type:complete len:232 (-) Transcript_8726:15-710(-)
MNEENHTGNNASCQCIGRREPSQELQRQIDSAIVAQSDRRQQRGHVTIPSGKRLPPTSGSVADEIEEKYQQNQNKISKDPGVPPPGSQFEYLNHPADIVLHSWGNDFPSALVNLAISMFGYITSLESISINEKESLEHGGEVIAQGHNECSLVYAFLDEWLYNFHDTGFVAKVIRIIEFDTSLWRITSCGTGELIDLRRHPQGTEIKAITYSGMRIKQSEGRCDITVVVDI